MRLRRLTAATAAVTATGYLGRDALLTHNLKAVAVTVLCCGIGFWLFDIAVVAFGRTARAAADAYTDGWESGYDKGYREGRRATTLRVAPIRMKEAENDAVG